MSISPCMHEIKVLEIPRSVNNCSLFKYIAIFTIRFRMHKFSNRVRLSVNSLHAYFKNSCVAISNSFIAEEKPKTLQMSIFMSLKCFGAFIQLSSFYIVL